MKYILQLAVLLITIQLAAQNTANPNITFSDIKKEITLPPAIKKLESSNKFFIQYPSTLTYHTKEFDITSINQVNVRFKIEPGSAKKKEGADYIFNIKTNGIAVNKDAPTPVSYKASYAKSYNTSIPSGNFSGFVYKIRYYFPITVEVINKEGVIEKEFLFNADSGTLIYHADFLLEPTRTQAWLPEKLVIPFNNTADLSKSYAANEAAILKRMEYNIWYYTVENIRTTLEMAYNDRKLSREAFYYKVFTKKYRSDFPEIVELIDKNENSIKQLGDAKTRDAAIADLKTNLESFHKVYENINKYAVNTKKVLLCNAAWCALFAQDLGKAKQYFNEYMSVEDDEYEMYLTYKNLYQELNNYYSIKNQEKPSIFAKNQSPILNVEKFSTYGDWNY